MHLPGELQHDGIEQFGYFSHLGATRQVHFVEDEQDGALGILIIGKWIESSSLPLYKREFDEQSSRSLASRHDPTKPR